MEGESAVIGVYGVEEQMVVGSELEGSVNREIGCNTAVLSGIETKEHTTDAMQRIWQRKRVLSRHAFTIRYELRPDQYTTLHTVRCRIA